MTPPLRWDTDAQIVHLLDQTRLPREEIWLEITTPEAMAEAIVQLRVRGAPAIGIAAGYGVVLAAKSAGEVRHQVREAIALLAKTRPTAINLFWALNRMKTVLEHPSDKTLFDRLLHEAQAIESEDRKAGARIGQFGIELLQDGASLLTHCHAGGVATSGYGTALAPMHQAHQQGWQLHVFVDETRPLLQGSRITAWELQKAGIATTLITDSMSGHVMQQGKVDAVIVGADRIAANGDVANKIGTYNLAVLAHAHGIPFYVAAPLSTVDFATPDGAAIPIEERAYEEITNRFGLPTAPADIAVYNPAFDVTPARLVTAFITEHGIIRPPYDVAWAAFR